MSERLRERGGNYTFLDRHPESVLLPSAALFGFFAYLSFARVVVSRGPVGTAWLPSALIGVAGGIAVLAVTVARLRVGKVGWPAVIPLVLMFAVLLSTKQEVWAFPKPPGLVTTGFENAELAFCGVLNLEVVLAFGWMYRVTGENQMMAGRSARMPRGDLHISRAGSWRDSAANPIEQGEWEELAERSGLGLFDPHSEQAREDQIVYIMRSSGLDRAAAQERIGRRASEQQKLQEFVASRPALVAKYPDDAAALLPGLAARPGSAPRQKAFTLPRADGSRLRLFWSKSQVTAVGVGPDLAADAALLSPLAQALNARVYDESGTLIS
jgi:hypothetical protein